MEPFDDIILERGEEQADEPKPLVDGKYRFHFLLQAVGFLNLRFQLSINELKMYICCYVALDIGVLIKYLLLY